MSPFLFQVLILKGVRGDETLLGYVSFVLQHFIANEIEQQKTNQVVVV